MFVSHSFDQDVISFKITMERLEIALVQKVHSLSDLDCYVELVIKGPFGPRNAIFILTTVLEEHLCQRTLAC